MTGKIIKGIAGLYYVHAGQQIYGYKARGVFCDRKLKPLVGDNAEITVLDEETLEDSVDEILPRSNTLVRPAVANIDQASMVFAIAHPSLNLDLLDKFLVMVERLEIPVAIVFNKIDLTDEVKMNTYRSIHEPAGYRVLFASASDDSGMEDIHALIWGKITVLAGPPGVGKSFLINILQPLVVMETGTINEKVQRGRHTIRHSGLPSMEEGAYVVDTPGFSSMYVGGMQAEELKHYFPKFEWCEEACKLLGCIHIGEKVCGVKDAVERGEVSQSRYEDCRLFYQELREKQRYQTGLVDC